MSIFSNATYYQGHYTQSNQVVFSQKKFSARDLNILKKAANSAYRSYREALRVGLEKIAVDFIKDLK